MERACRLIVLVTNGMVAAAMSAFLGWIITWINCSGEVGRHLEGTLRQLYGESHVVGNGDLLLTTTMKGGSQPSGGETFLETDPTGQQAFKCL